ncbi:oligosaccharide flippase family protein [Mucilaginibacter sp. KACC 22063]|uniref:oligosaccharide flippase family protein n=1 Tax=Mucilaginibacter sp. KACC 22063 TaxID=3025666 RepID=UPI0023668329|nr:oligosaccharide flippase family protein [Mucilaginibacter sp. KACC 22063]WDF53816.1 oligosaccharide flippase family protein [Mucilaginibacter sp. KACC 22063]
MMAGFSRNFKSISANTVQFVINQVLGLLIFYVLSTNLTKNDFGRLNWALAVILTAFSILSCGIDQLAVKRIAEDDDTPNIMNLYIWHVLITGALFYLTIIGSYFLFSGSKIIIALLLGLGLGKMLNYFSTPLKQLANAKERFALLAKMSAVANVVKGLGLFIALLLHAITLKFIVAIFVIGDVCELLATVILYIKYLKVNIKVRWNRQQYVNLLKQALPQIGVILFSSALARFDWIFIGLYLPAPKLAEYSFAYKAFEISTMPLLVIAPLLVPKFVNILKTHTQVPAKIFEWLQAELIIAFGAAIVLNLCWSPLVDAITSHKYGAVNKQVVFLLSMCGPVLYVNNFLWSINFAHGRMKFILKVFAITFFINLVGDVWLIQVWGNVGAAAAFLIATIVQGIMYCTSIKEVASKISLSFIVSLVCALISMMAASYIFNNVVASTAFGMAIYLILLFITRTLNKEKLSMLKSFTTV